MLYSKLAWMEPGNSSREEKHVKILSPAKISYVFIACGCGLQLQKNNDSLICHQEMDPFAWSSQVDSTKFCVCVVVLRGFKGSSYWSCCGKNFYFDLVNFFEYLFVTLFCGDFIPNVTFFSLVNWRDIKGHVQCKLSLLWGSIVNCVSPKNIFVQCILYLVSNFLSLLRDRLTLQTINN